MDSKQIQQKVYSTWKSPSELENANGSIIALDAETGELRFHTYIINSKAFSKLWQYQFGYNVETFYSPTTIQCWKYLQDCSFDSLNWKSNNILPKKDEEVICWINLSDYNPSYTHIQNNINGRLPLAYLASRIHIGIFREGFFSNKLCSDIYKFENINWKNIFKWLSLDDFFKANEDPRLFSIDPNKSFSLDWLHKINK